MVFCFYTEDESYVKLSTILKQVLLFDTFLHIPKRLSSHLLKIIDEQKFILIIPWHSKMLGRYIE